MEKLTNQKQEEIVEILKSGGIGVYPTDTIYGLLGKALAPKTIERIYAARKRRPDKPFIILIGSIVDLKLFKIKISEKTEKILKKFWPGAVSVILPCPAGKLSYLHRRKNSLAFRLPADKELRNLLGQIGPLAAPSANLEGEPPAFTIKEAKKYFGDKIDFYFDIGRLESEPSTLIQIENGKVKVLREGAVNIKNKKLRN